MLHEAKDRQKFVSDVQYLRDIQHKVDSEYQECLRQKNSRKDSNEKKQDQIEEQETSMEKSWLSSGPSSKQDSEEEDSLTETPPVAKSSLENCDSPKLPTIDQTAVKQKHKSTMTSRKSESMETSTPSPGDSSEHPLFCVEYSPFCSVFAFSPVPQPNTNYCCLLLPLVPPASSGVQSPGAQLPPVPPFPLFRNSTSLGSPACSPSPLPESPASLCYFPISRPTPAETPVLCLPGPRRPSRIYLVCSPGTADFVQKEEAKPGEIDCQPRTAKPKSHQEQRQTESPAASAAGHQLPKPRPQTARTEDGFVEFYMEGEHDKQALNSVVQQEGPLWAGDTKLKRPPQERRNIAPYSQNMAMAESNLKRGKRWDPSILSHGNFHPPQTQPFQVTRNPRGLSEALRPSLLTASLGTVQRTPFRFRDEDFYAEVALNPGGDGLDTDEETCTKEEPLSASMYPARSPSNQRRSRFLTASASLTKNKTFEENPANWRLNPFRSEFSHGSLGVSTAGEPMTALPYPGQRPFCDPLLPKGDTAKENDRGDREHDKRTPHSWVTRSGCSLDSGDLRAGLQSREAVPLEEWPSSRDHLGVWRADLHHPSSSLDYFLLGPRAPRSSLNPTYHTPRSLIPSALSHIPPVDLSTISAHRSHSEAISRFNMRQPLCPIRNRNLLANMENQSSSESHSAQEQDVRRRDNATLSSQPQETLPHHARNPPCRFCSVEPTSYWPARMNLQDHLPVSDSLQENIPFTTFAVSEFPGQSDQENRATVSGLREEKEAPETKVNPEKLKKLQESLLEEDSEEEGDLCRICQIPGGSPTNPLLEPCACVGSLQFVHQECLKRWLKVKITSGADLHSVKTCEMCKKGLIIDRANFNMTEFFQKHQQFRTQSQLMNSGLYLVLLLHLYEQRFAALMRLSSNLVTIERLSRNYSQPRPEESENSEVGDESGVQSPSNRRVI